MKPKTQKHTAIVVVDQFDVEISKAKADAEIKANALADTLKKNVYPIVCVRPASKEIFVGFIQEPSRAAKMEAFDIMSARESLTGAGEIIINSSLLKSESHEAFSSEDSKYDDVFMGACVDALEHIKLLLNSLKKK